MWKKSGHHTKVAVRGALLTVTATVMASLMVGCAARFAPVDLAKPLTDPAVGGTMIAVIERGEHTDIALPVEAVAEPVMTLEQGLPGVRFLVFGFGDRAYYMSHDDSFFERAAALFPGAGVILVTALRASPADAFGADHVVTLRLSHAQLVRVNAFIGQALANDPNNSIRRLGDGPYDGSSFYASGDVYDAFHDCNNWTIAVLRSGGFSANPQGVIFADQAMKQARRIAYQQLQQ